jgi:cytochrome c oxidase subunit 1
MDANVKSDFLTKEGTAHAKPFFLFRRPTAKTGLVGWLTTVDHKNI